MSKINPIRLTLIVIFLGVMCYFGMKYREKKNVLKETKVIVTGQIYKTGILQFGDLSVDYKYVVDGEEFKGSTGLGLSAQYGDLVLGKYFPVVFSSLDTNNSDILIQPSDFERYNIPIPDSLAWVRNLKGW